MAYKPYKMKGHALPGIKQRSSKKMADGRASSSPFQKQSPAKDKEDNKEHTKAQDHNTGGEHVNQWGETSAEYIQRMKEMGLRSDTTETKKAEPVSKKSPAKQGLIWNKKIEKQMKEGFKEKMSPKGKKTYVKPEKEGAGKYHYKKAKRAKMQENVGKSVARVEKKSPAKIAPLIAMAGKALIGSAVSGMMKKKEEE